MTRAQRAPVPEPRRRADPAAARSARPGRPRSWPTSTRPPTGSPGTPRRAASRGRCSSGCCEAPAAGAAGRGTGMAEHGAGGDGGGRGEPGAGLRRAHRLGPAPRVDGGDAGAGDPRGRARRGERARRVHRRRAGGLHRHDGDHPVGAAAHGGGAAHRARGARHRRLPGTARPRRRRGDPVGGAPRPAVRPGRPPRPVRWPGRWAPPSSGCPCAASPGCARRTAPARRRRAERRDRCRGHATAGPPAAVAAGRRRPYRQWSKPPRPRPGPSPGRPGPSPGRPNPRSGRPNPPNGPPRSRRRRRGGPSSPLSSSRSFPLTGAQPVLQPPKRAELIGTKSSAARP